MSTLSRIGIAIFAITVMLGPLYTLDEYSSNSNLISELGAQHSPNGFIMVVAFLVMGTSIAVDGLRRFQRSLIPFILFGLAMGAVGLFPHKPIDPSIDFNQAYHNWHGILASVAGAAITTGFVWQGFICRGKRRYICFYLALVALLFPALMLGLPDYQGLIQRLMYLQLLGWIWLCYPRCASESAIVKLSETIG